MLEYDLNKSSVVWRAELRAQELGMPDRGAQWFDGPTNGMTAFAVARVMKPYYSLLTTSIDDAELMRDIASGHHSVPLSTAHGVLLDLEAESQDEDVRSRPAAVTDKYLAHIEVEGLYFRNYRSSSTLTRVDGVERYVGVVRQIIDEVADGSLFDGTRTRELLPDSLDGNASVDQLFTAMRGLRRESDRFEHVLSAETFPQVSC